VETGSWDLFDLDRGQVSQVAERLSDWLEQSATTCDLTTPAPIEACRTEKRKTGADGVLPNDLSFGILTSSAGKFTEGKIIRTAEKTSRSIVLRVYLGCAENRALRENSRDGRRNRHAAQHRIPFSRSRIADVGDG